MKKWLLAALLLPQVLFASFWARNMTYPNHDWSTFEVKQLDFSVDVTGLFYETTVTFQLKLVPTRWQSPHPGLYEITWDFDLFEDAVVTDCWIKPPSGAEFVRAQIIDLTTAEEEFRYAPENQPRLLLRHRYQRQWDGTIMKRFQMKFSPAANYLTPTIKLTYLAPCRQYYNSRRLTLPIDELNNYGTTPATVRIRDVDHPDDPPTTINNTGSSWRKVGNEWTTTIPAQRYYRTFVGIVPEASPRQFLQTFSDGEHQFYQLAIAPPIKQEDIEPRNILLAVDLIGDHYNLSQMIKLFQQAVSLSTFGRDSVTMIYSEFVPTIADSSFEPATPARLASLFNRVLGANPPSLNTLPHLLKQGVGLFNSKNKGGEFWLLTDARTHSDPPATAMEIIGQSLGQADKPIIFRIINADLDTWPYQWINSQSYYGNDYLYDNLARLSWGTYQALRFRESFDYLDAMLDGLAPTASSVEVDANPEGGLSYSRYQLNSGRVTFPTTLPYYEIGLFDGSAPFTTHFYGLLDGELLARDVTLAPTTDYQWSSVKTFWYELYVRDLLLEPQSYETIRYIENVSTEHRILTPYSGFIVPGPQGKLAFQRLTEAIQTGVESGRTETLAAPENYELAAFPNPFNAATRIVFDLPPNLDAKTIRLQIFNSIGQLVLDKEVPTDGSSHFELLWDGMADSGEPAPSGLYFVTVRAGTVVKNLKITMIK